MGYAGQISLGHARLLWNRCLYTAILTTRYALPTFVAFWASAVSAAAMAYFIGRPILKLKGYFLALATLGSEKYFWSSFGSLLTLRWSHRDLLAIPWFLSWGSPSILILNSIISFGSTHRIFVFSKNLVRSKIGRALLAVAASEDAAQSVGINVPRIKLEIFVLGAAYAGMAGSLFACIMSIANPEAFSLGLTVLIVMMVILGGMGNLYGPVAGAILLTWLMDILSKYQEYSLPIYSVILILLLPILPGRYWSTPECEGDLPDRLLGEEEEER